MLQVNLTNSTIPVSIQFDSGGTLTRLPDDWVVHDQLQPFIEPLNVPNLINKDEPLLSIKITFLPRTKETVLGIMISHMIGESLYPSVSPINRPLAQADAHSTLRFTHCLSQLYQNIDPDPSLEVYTSPVPFPSASNDPAALLKSKEVNRFVNVRHFNLGAVQQVFVKDWQRTEKVSIRFTPNQVDAIRRIAKREPTDDPVASETTPVPISRKDALTAYVVTVLNRFVDEELVLNVRNNFNVCRATLCIQASPPTLSHIIMIAVSSSRRACTCWNQRHLVH